MTVRRKIFVCALASLASSSSGANALPLANCGLTGKWHLGELANNGSAARSIDCEITISANGHFTGQCAAFGPNAVNASINGTMKANAKCLLSGMIITAAPNIPVTTITGGFAKGNVGYLVGIRGTVNIPTEERLGILLKD